MKFRTSENSNSPGPSSSQPPSAPPNNINNMNSFHSNEDNLSAFTNTILTRSAAKLHSQNNSTSPLIGAKRASHTAHAHGKIVKPIPVRAISSSSSTHSSSFTSTNHSTSQNSASLLSLIKQGTHDLKNAPNDSSFSLIAKYFASFPATRLKSTNHFESNSQSQSPVFDQTSSKHTPFLPFKKFNSINNMSCTPLSSSQLKPFDLFQTSFTSNTDHLCTNFKRMIKLNNDEESHFSPASPLTGRSSNTPNSLFNEQDFDYSNDSDQIDSRFGQITMETRSTRKFLIKHHKHHPYLKYNNQLLSSNSVSPSQSRPSINLLKMKKLKREDSPLLCDSSQFFAAASAAAAAASTDTVHNTRRKNKLLSTKKSTCKKSDVLVEEDFYAEESTDCYDFNDVMQEMNASFQSKEIDDCKEEDSSGYYSSYHSVDLVSTSGGSCVGDNLVKRQSSDKHAEKQTVSSVHTQKPQEPQPHHHYQTRYFTNYLQSISNQQKLSPKPVTRLRYQQQLASSNNSNNQSCDLDLDQIEND